MRKNKAFSPDLLRDLHTEPALKPVRVDELEVTEGDAGRELLPLSQHEERRLEECEQIINRGLNTFIEVGQAMAEIRNRRLYRSTYRTFEAYCQQKWQLKRQRAYEMMGASEVVRNLSEISDILPTKESHAASLVKLSPKDQQSAWAELVAETEDMTSITANDVKRKVKDKMRKSYSAKDPSVEANEAQTILEELSRSLGKGIKKAPEQVFVTISGQWLIKNNLDHVWRELRGVSRPIDHNFSDVITIGEAFDLGILRPSK